MVTSPEFFPGGIMVASSKGRERTGEEIREMKKLVGLIISSIVLLSWVSNGYAAVLFGYAIVPKQATFYIFILSVIGTSVAMVFALYFSLWMADLKKKKNA